MKIIGIGTVLVASSVLYVSSAVASDLCKAQADDVAGCQPGPFDPPLAQMPTRRVNAAGQIDPKASDEDDRRGAKLLEQKLGLFRNFEHIHWVAFDPSRTDKTTGVKSGGSLDGDSDGRGLTISGQCLFGGHLNAPGVLDPMGSQNARKAAEEADRANGTVRAHGVYVYRIQKNAAKDPPVLVDQIPPPLGAGYEDTMLNAAMIAGVGGAENNPDARHGSVVEQRGRPHVRLLD